MRYSAIGLVALALGTQSVAEVVVGLGVVGLESDGGAVLGDGLVSLALARQDGAQLLCASAYSGLIRMAVRYSAMASSSLPWTPQGDAQVVVGLGVARA